MSSHEPPAGDGWLFEVKHDGHRLAVIADGNGGVRLLSRNGYERSRHFGAVFADLARLGRQLVLDGEITAPDERGVTHLDDLAAAMQRRDTERSHSSPSTSCTSTAATFAVAR